jgi:two-component system, chemotaxis family, chemotaxis protein CheY
MGRTLCGRLRTHSGRLRILTTQLALGSLVRPPADLWQSTAQVAGKRVLVVDDDPDIRELLFTALEDEGFEVVPAGNGQEALAIIKTFRPDVIVLDLMMPVMDGWQFAAELRARDEGDEDIPIVLLSAARDLKTHAKALAAADIIEKPFDLAELLPKIARVASAA